jgi:hypothetical protein
MFFLPHQPAFMLTVGKRIAHKTGASPGGFIAHISKKGLLPDKRE